MIEAVQLDTTLATGQAVIAWVREQGGRVVGYSVNGPRGAFYTLEIETLEGVMIAGPGDWIICGVKGEFYPCKSDIFEATYDPTHIDGGTDA